MMAFIVVVIVWILPAVLAALMGRDKDRLNLGIILGLFLGWIGVIIMVGVAPTDAARRATAFENGQAFACPFCREPVRTGATVCPHCQRDLPGHTP